jgi:predicted  nucleic acid-binding Zn-ribbon protein
MRRRPHRSPPPSNPTPMANVDQETDSLAGLEERVLRAVQLVQRLRGEKDGLAKEIEQLNEELEALRSERKQVRGRIEKLLGQIDTLGQ